MFRNKTTFVIGAGASKEVNMPVGSELAELIFYKCDLYFEQFAREPKRGDKRIFSYFLQKEHHQIAEFVEASRAIRDGIFGQNSIDDYLNIHRENEFIVRYGKACIAQSIIEKEKNSDLFVADKSNKKELDLRRLKNTWYVELLKILCHNIQKDDVEKIFDNVSFVVFNYDRCLEYFLYYSIRDLYQLTDEEILRVMGKAKILHPYGQIGQLPELKKGMISIPFGAHSGGHEARFDLESIAGQLLLYTEDSIKATISEDIRATIENSYQLICLGFGFHEQNLKILSPSNKEKIHRIYATSHGISEENLEEISNEIDFYFRSTPQFSQYQKLSFRPFPNYCVDFMRRLSRVLMKAA